MALSRFQLHDASHETRSKPNSANGPPNTPVEHRADHSPIREAIFIVKHPPANFVAEAAVVALVGLGLALAGPFGSATLPLGNRFIYWIGGLLVAWVVFRLIVLATREITRLLRWPDAVSYLLAIPLLGVFVLIARGQSSHDAGSSLALYIEILAIGGGFFLLFWLIYLRAEPDTDKTQHPPEAETGEIHCQPAGHSAMAGVPDCPLHQKLPAGFGPIIALQVEDHYVKVHAQGRSEMLLSSLSAAISEIPPSAGMQVHRSWWVAHSAVLHAKREGRNVQLALVGSLTVPVSRARIAAIRKEGWL